MVEPSTTDDIIEGLTLGADIIYRSSSMLIIGGLYYWIPSLAAIRVCLKPHEILNVGHIVYDVARLSYLIGRGLIHRLVKIKDYMLALP